MNKFTIALSVLLSVPALAADYHVLRDLDGDGFANPCVNAAHDNHLTADNVVTCGTTFDIDNDGTAETIYCDIQAALNIARDFGDTVEIHGDSTANGTWTAEDFVVADQLDDYNLCNPDMMEAYLVIKANNASQESHRRYVRGASMNSSVDTPKITSSTSSGGRNLAIALGLDSTDTTNFVTISDLEITGFDDECGSVEVNYFGMGVVVVGSADALVIERLNIHDVDLTNKALSSERGVAGIYIGGTSDSGSDPSADRLIIRNNTIDAWLPIVIEGSCASGCSGAYISSGVDITNNLLHSRAVPNPGWPSKWTLAKCVDTFVFRNNQVLFDDNTNGEEAGVRLRNVNNAWIFNNYLYQFWMWYTQSDSGSACGTHRYFNNTYVDDAIVANTQVHRPVAGATHRVYNELHDYSSSPTNNPFDCSSATIQTGYMLWNTSTFQAACTVSVDDGHYICKDSAACGTGAESAYTECSTGSTTCNPVTANIGYLASGAKPHPYYSLGSSAIVIGEGTNDPEGGNDGASCSIPAWAGRVIDCSTDFDGDTRGSVWDIGADEYAVGGNPQVCGNNSIEGTELCDGTDFGTDSCVGRGFAGGNLTCNSCTSITTENCTLAGVSRSVLQGVTLKGGTIK